VVQIKEGIFVEKISEIQQNLKFTYRYEDFKHQRYLIFEAIILEKILVSEEIESFTLYKTQQFL